MAKRKEENMLIVSRGLSIFNSFFCVLVFLIVAYPLYYVLIASFSDPMMVSAGKVVFWPEGFTLKGRGWSGGLCAGGCRSFVLPAPLERRYDPFGGHAAVGRAAVDGWKSGSFGERQAASAVFAGVRADFRLLPAAGGTAG